MEFLAAAIALGFLGSFHCIGMCGPIALALPVHHRPATIKYLLILLYNLGRISTYALLGFVAGLLGKTFVMAGLQQALSISVGIILLSSVIFSFKGLAQTNQLFLALQRGLSRLFSIERSSAGGGSLFLIGLLNGLLPCGLVYMGLAGAVATGDMVEGVLFMVAFGVGTVPMMLLLPLFSASISPFLRKRIQKAVPVVVAVMAILLIVRGLNLGIPYLSPQINKGGTSVSCHEAGSPSSTANPVIHCAKPGSDTRP